jgi:hypothetical protein
VTQSEPTPLQPVPDQPEEERSALDLRPDGRIVIAFESGEVTLRRPTLGQFRRWRMRLTEISEDGLRLVTQARAATDAEREDETLTDADRMARRIERSTQQTEASEDASIAWWGEVFEALAEQPVPDVDEWPPFLVFGEEILGLVLAHWRQVPLAPGSRSNLSK